MPLTVNRVENQGKDFFADAEVISTYTRAQAIKDGVLIDISEWAKEYGFKFPVAVTTGVWGMIDDPEGMKCAGQSAKGRGLDVVAMLKMYARRGNYRLLPCNLCYPPVQEKRGSA